ncbi:MAG: hypothetical protein K0R58_2605 [Ramlibacter sp.]|nr:hypothetical protein [Ramlibacter sp.]
MVLAACAAGALPVRADEERRQGDIDVSLSHESSSGRYGQASRTRIGQTTLGLRYRASTWWAELEIPWIEVRDPAGASLPDVAGGGVATVERGLGDAWIKGGIELVPAGDDATGVELVAKFKTRTGDAARGLGTGGTDWAFQLEFFRPVGAWGLFGHAGFRITGDVEGARAYRDPLYAELGVSRRFSRTWDGGTYLTVREAVGALGPVREATVFAAYSAGAWRHQLYLTRGLSRASPDLALGLGVRRRF